MFGLGGGSGGLGGGGLWFDTGLQEIAARLTTNGMRSDLAAKNEKGTRVT